VDNSVDFPSFQGSEQPPINEMEQIDQEMSILINSIIISYLQSI